MRACGGGVGEGAALMGAGRWQDSGKLCCALGQSKSIFSAFNCNIFFLDKMTDDG